MKKLLLSLSIVVTLAAAADAQFFKSETTREAGTRMSQGDRAGAMAILDRAINKGKDLLEAHQMRGDLRAMAGDIDGAIADFSAVLEINPSNAPVYERRAMYRSFKRDYEGAVKDYDAAIANGARTERNFVGRARVKEDLGELAGAVADYENALAFKSDLASAHVGLANLRDRQGDSDAAILVLQDFIDRYEGKRDGKLPTAPATPGGIDTKVIKREGTEKDGSQVFMIGTGPMPAFSANTPEEAEKKAAQREQLMNVSLAYFTLGRLYTRKDSLDAALGNIEKGLKIKGDDPYGYMLRSEIRMKRGDLAGTIEDLTFFVKSPMAGPNLYLEKGILLVLQGKNVEAEKEFERHLQIFPAGRNAVDRRIEEAKKLRSTQPPK